MPISVLGKFFPEGEQPERKRSGTILWRLAQLVTPKDIPYEEMTAELQAASLPHLVGESQEDHEKREAAWQQDQECSDLLEGMITIGTDPGFADVAGKSMAQFLSSLEDSCMLASWLHKIAFLFQALRREGARPKISREFLASSKNFIENNADFTDEYFIDEIIYYLDYISGFCDDFAEDDLISLDKFDTKGKKTSMDIINDLHYDPGAGEYIHLDEVEAAGIIDDYMRDENEKILDPKFLKRCEAHLRACKTCQQSIDDTISALYGVK